MSVSVNVPAPNVPAPVIREPGQEITFLRLG